MADQPEKDNTMNSGKIVRRNWFTFGLLCLTAAFVGILMSASQSAAQGSQVQVSPSGTPILALASPIAGERITLKVEPQAVGYRCWVKEATR